MYNLLIIESPGKKEKIQKMLGSDWRVVASFGHIRKLKENIEFIDKDFVPSYEYIKQKSRAINDIKEIAKNAHTIYIGSDRDLEGEQIAYSICLLLKLNPKTAKRITFTEITEKAIKHAVEHPQTLDMNQVHAQQARAMLDMMIGFTISPLLWKYVAPSLSAGRCQTPALRLVIEREDAIQDFKASSSWQLQATFQHPSLTFDATMTDELEDEESAMNYMENIYKVSKGIVTNSEIKPWSESAPKPFMTSTLQQQASALYGINPANTMKIAQKLYEAGHITYMRTDKAVLSEEAAIAAKEWVKTAYGEEYVGQAQPKVKAQQQAPQAQEAHEAIRPTHMEAETIQGDANEKKLYRLIWQRTIQSVMSPARGETCHITIQIQGDTDFSWMARWKRTTFEGWKRVGSVANLDEDESLLEQTTEWNKASLMKLGDKVEWSTIRAEAKESKAKGRYTEATLVRDMETYGIGRPSTFASLLSTIQEKDYVAIRDLPAKEVLVAEYQIHPQTWPPTKSETKKKSGAEKNKLVPTDLGRSVWNWLKTQFDDLFAYGFTAQMEQRLDQIAHPELIDDPRSWKLLLHEIWNSYRARVETLGAALNSKDRSNPKIRTFSNGLKAVQSKKGPILLMEGETKGTTQFFGWPKDTAFDQITEEQAIQFQKDQNILRSGSDFGEWNGNRIQKRSGKFGSYLQSGSISIPFQENEPIEETVRRLEAKQTGGGGAAGVIRAFKEFMIRTGPYGPYIVKPSLKKPQFVSLPKGVDPHSLKETEVAALYKLGLEEKKRHKTYSRGPKAPADTSFLPASK